MNQEDLLSLLIIRCLDKGLIFKALYTDNDGNFVVAVQDKEKSGSEPVQEYMRDYLDYRYAYDAWVRRGLEIIAVDNNSYGALNSALEYLDTL